MQSLVHEHQVSPRVQTQREEVDDDAGTDDEEDRCNEVIESGLGTLSPRLIMLVGCEHVDPHVCDVEEARSQQEEDPDWRKRVALVVPAPLTQCPTESAVTSLGGGYGGRSLIARLFHSVKPME